MNKPTQTTSNDPGTLAEDARDLMAATADMDDEKISEARKRLAAALERGKEIAGKVRDQTVAGARIADKTIRENPYSAVTVGIGIGVLVGYLLGRRCSRNCD